MTKRYIGFQETLPIQKGSIVTVLRGAVVRMSGGRTRVVLRDRKVTVHSVFQGITIPAKEGAPGYTANPTVRWIANQEEFEADVNDLKPID